jgi:Domain of unknown function (DUF4328)
MTVRVSEGLVRPAWNLGTLTMAMLGIWTVLALGDMVALGLHIGFLGDADSAQQWESLSQLNSLLWLVSVAQSAVASLAGALFCLWLLRARANAERIMSCQRYGRSWVVVGWVFPIANLWIPKQIVDDVWRASARRADGRKPRLVLAWWACYLVFSITDVVSVEAWGDGGTSSAAGRNLDIFDITMVLVPGMAAAVLAAAVIWKVNSMQQVALRG